MRYVFYLKHKTSAHNMFAFTRVRSHHFQFYYVFWCNTFVLLQPLQGCINQHVIALYASNRRGFFVVAFVVVLDFN